MLVFRRLRLAPPLFPSPHPQPQRIREAELCDIVVRTLRAGGSVLLPCSPGGRALELILLLTSHWREKRNLDVRFFLPDSHPHHNHHARAAAQPGALQSAQDSLRPSQRS